jgi:hypothetical protein
MKAWIRERCAKSMPSFTADDGMSLPIDAYQFWYEALRDNRADDVMHVLSGAPADERERLVNGQFDYLEDDLHVPVQLGNTSIRNTLSVCVIHGSFDVVSVLMEYGVTVDRTDYGGGNILHLLVKRSVFRPREEQWAIDTYR